MQYDKVKDMPSLIDELRNYEECAILGNGVSMMDVDLDQLDGILTIGVNHIELMYIPDILLWVDRYKDRLGDIAHGKAPLKVCREGSYNSDIEGMITFSVDKSEPFGHEWTGKLKKVGCYLTALHLAMICFKKIWLVGCDFSEDAHFYKYDQFERDDHSDASRKVNFLDTWRANLTYFQDAARRNTQCKIYQTCAYSRINCFEYKKRFYKNGSGHLPFHCMQT